MLELFNKKEPQMSFLGNNSDLVDPNIRETSWIDPLSMDYHMKKWNEPNESTKAFSNYFVLNYPDLRVC
jgi:hypothetical protein